MKEKPFKLTKRDIDILKVLWSAEKPRSASDIVSDDENLTINTVQTELRKLLKNDYIKVADIGYSGTVLCRLYSAAVSPEAVGLQQVTNEFNQWTKFISPSTVTMALLNQDNPDIDVKDEISKLEEMIQQLKKK